MSKKYTIYLTVQNEASLKRAAKSQYIDGAQHPDMLKKMLNDWRSIRKEHRDPIEADIVGLIASIDGVEVRKIKRRL